MSIDKIVDAYLEAGLWSTSICGGENDMQVMDEFYDLDDCANREEVEREIADFIISCFSDIAWLIRYDAERKFALDYTLAQIGHDFLLTRDRHGAGFWDRGYPEPLGRNLTEAAHPYGESGFTPVYDDNEQQTDKFTCEGSGGYG